MFINFLRYMYGRRKHRYNAEKNKMKKIVFIYSSKFGHAKQYAEWLKEDISDADAIDISKFNPVDLLAYKLIVFVSGVYGDKMPVMDFVKKNISAISPQKIMFLAISWYPNDSEEAIQKLTQYNYPEQFTGVVPLYVVNSGIDKKKISPVDTMKLLATQVLIERKDERTNDDINALAIIKGYSDYTSKENLSSIKKAIDEFFTPKQSEKKVLTKINSEQAIESTPAPVSKLIDVSEMETEADALSSFENAFKALKSPKITEAPAQSVNETKNSKSKQDAVSEIVPEKIHEIPFEPTPKTIQNVEEIQEAFSTIKDTTVTNDEPISKPEINSTEIPFYNNLPTEENSNSKTDIVHTVEVPTSESVKTEQSKNSYMELFAQRRKKFAEESQNNILESNNIEKPNIELSENTAQAAEQASESALELKNNQYAGSIYADILSELDFLDHNAISEHNPTNIDSTTAKNTNTEIDSITDNVYEFDFISDESEPAVSNRVLNVVQDLAKAMEEAEKALKNVNNTNNFGNEAKYDKIKQDMTILANDAISLEAKSETNDDIDKFDFDNNIDYDPNDIEIDSRVGHKTIYQNNETLKDNASNLDFRRLQDEVNASIETNKAAKEKYANRYGKKSKEEIQNPFLVQFEESNKKKKKNNSSVSKRLSEPIDPDIFFNRPGKDNYNTDNMPEIRFRRK